ncbi:MAG: hypothetical protein M3H12_05995, partial [Chromatiales bacterium]
MVGKVGGVQAKIKVKYPKAAFVHCAAHRLDLVVNDLNSVAEVRESPKRRSLVPYVPILCETRWTIKYHIIGIFTHHFKHLCILASADAGKTSQDAHQLQGASETSPFLVCLVIMAKYSAMLEPVTQALQAVQLDILKIHDRIQQLLVILE